jgi:hypothetical protein
MSRKTLPLTAILVLSGGLATGCSGTDTDPGRAPPEICDDGIDNDGDDLIDCDDTEACGGLQCITGTTDTDITVPLDPAEILFDATTCCDFTFTQGDCPLLVGTYQAANASCDLIGGTPPLSFTAPGCPNCPIPYLTNSPIDPDTTVTIEVWFECQVGETFTTTCHTKLDVDPFSDEREFEVTGTRMDP